MDKITDYWYNLDMKKVKEYKHLIMLDLEKDDLDKISNGDDFVKAYEDKVTELNNQETFRSFMSYEEDQRLIQNTEKHMAYEEGTKQEKIEIAKNLLSLRTLSIEDISKATGLDKNTLQKLSQEMK